MASVFDGLSRQDIHRMDHPEMYVPLREFRAIVAVLAERLGVTEITISRVELGRADAKFDMTRFETNDPAAIHFKLTDRTAVFQSPGPLPHPYTVGRQNSQITGWHAYFAGTARDANPFPPARTDLKRGYETGWDEAAEADRQRK